MSEEADKEDIVQRLATQSVIWDRLGGSNTARLYEDATREIEALRQEVERLEAVVDDLFYEKSTRE